MARDWSSTEANMALLQARLVDRAPDNIAPIPIATSYEQDDVGQWKWFVDVHVKRPGITEYDLTGIDDTFAGAIRKAYLGLSNEGNLTRWAHDANARFGVEP